jgi:DNA-3-methyladenine glycosylase
VPRAPRFRFALPTERVAHDLLGWRLERLLASGECLTGRIVETEAYPPGDPASHAARGSTPRCATMFARPGLAYVYFIYGVHWCLNVVSEPDGIGAAVLVRGLDGIDGCNGPARLCRRLGVDGTFDGVDLLDPRSPLRLLPPTAAPEEPVVVAPRIGITRAADAPLRFYLLGSSGVSRRDRIAEAAARD